MFRASVAFALCACVAGCAAPGALPATADTAAPLPADIISAQGAKDAIAIGKSTKADVIAALGKTVVINFDSGFEVWVYRVKGSEKETSGKTGLTALFAPRAAEKATPAKTEFVVLFAPSGVVTKTRIRPAPGEASE